MKKPRLQIVPTNTVKVAKLGGSASSKSPPNPLLKKSYSKAKPPEEFVSHANFGMTGLTGES